MHRQWRAWQVGLACVCVAHGTQTLAAPAGAPRPHTGRTAALEQPASDVPRVVRKGQVVSYDGGLDARAIAQVRRYARRGATTLSISSPGGDVELGMQLGRIVFAHRMHVRVREVCLSSCANYVFPAGASKTLGPHSLLGWHGGMTQDMAGTLDPALKVQYKAYVARVGQLEKAYFATIGVDQASTTYGQRP